MFLCSDLSLCFSATFAFAFGSPFMLYSEFSLRTPCSDVSLKYCTSCIVCCVSCSDIAFRVPALFLHDSCSELSLCKLATFRFAQSSDTSLSFRCVHMLFERASLQFPHCTPCGEPSPAERIFASCRAASIRLSLSRFHQRTSLMFLLCICRHFGSTLHHKTWQLLNTFVLASNRLHRY